MVHEHKTTAVRQKEIVLAARRLIIKRGAEHLTVRSIAAEVGISESAIYRHFSSKQDILCLLLDDIERNLIDDIDVERKSADASLGTVDVVLRHHLSRLEQRRGIRFQVIAEIISLGDKTLNRRAYDTVQKYIACIRQLLLDGMETGTIRRDIDSTAAATLLFSIVQGVVNVWALSNYGIDPVAQYEPMWQIVRQAIEVPRD
jgi:AcrR family transcriptional regulator